MAEVIKLHYNFPAPKSNYITIQLKLMKLVCKSNHITLKLVLKLMAEYEKVYFALLKVRIPRFKFKPINELPS